jgi:SAM-dependent methyltransferase
MMKARAFEVEKYVLLEPGALNYVANTKDAVYMYASGQIDGFDGKTVVVNAGGEHLDLFSEVFDTIMMINVLEHTNNAVSILRGLYNALKPGGLLIMNERWWETHNPHGALGLDSLYHPIRMKKSVFDHFLSVGFDIIRDCRTAKCHNADIVKNYGNSTYFIGRKKKPCA